jgi:hypothetical protein
MKFRDTLSGQDDFVPISSVIEKGAEQLIKAAGWRRVDITFCYCSNAILAVGHDPPVTLKV